MADDDQLSENDPDGKSGAPAVSVPLLQGSPSSPRSAAFPLNLSQFVQLNAVVAGLELAASAGFTYIPPMLLKAGFDENHMSWIIGTGPFVCLIVVPFLGSWSDKCRSTYGRRVPFIFALCLAVILGLALIPYSDHVVSNTFPKAPGMPEIPLIWRRLAAFALALGVISLDFGTQACLTPCETMLSDITDGTCSRERAFTVYSAMCSGGSCLGYLITAIDWESTPVGKIFGDQENTVFALLLILFVLTMAITLRAAMRAQRAGVGVRLVAEDSSRNSLSSVVSSTSRTDQTIAKPGMFTKEASPVHNISSTSGGQPLVSRTSGRITDGPILTRWLSCCLRGGPFVVRALARYILGALAALLPYNMRNFLNIPIVLRRLMLACFFAWAGVMCFTIFYTEYVGEVVYHGSPSSLVGSPERDSYERGLRVGSLGLLLHSVVSGVAAYLIERVGGSFGHRPVLLACMGGFALVSFLLVFAEDVVLVTFLATLTGVGFAALTTIPFTLMGLYHEDKQVFFADVPADTRELRGMGSDMALLDTTYFSSQVLLLAFMGTLVQVMGTAKAYMLTTSTMATLSCYFSAQVIYDKTNMAAAMGSAGLEVGNGTVSSPQDVGKKTVVA